MRRGFLLLALLWAQPYKDLEGHTKTINAVAFTSDSRYLLSASSDGTVILWRLPYGTPVAHFTGATTSVNALALRQDSVGHIWGAASSGELYLWSIESYQNSAKNLKAETVWVPALRTEKLAYRLWRAERGAHPWEALALHPTKPLLYALTRTGRLVAWDTEEGWLQTFRDTAEVSYALILAEHAKDLYLGSGSGAIYALDPLSLSIKRTLRGHQGGIRGLAISPDQRTLASAGLDGKVMLWTIPEGLRTRTLEKHSEGVRAVAFSPDGRYLASADKEGLLCIWNVASGRLEKTLSVSVPLWTVAFSPNGQYLVAGGALGLLRLWRIDQLGIRPIQIIAETDSLYAPPTDIEDNIPRCDSPKPHRYAFIIGNEDYRSFQPTFTPAMNVPYAVRDAYAFRMYAEQMLGVPARNIVFLQNATSAQIRRELEKLGLLMQLSSGKAELFFYYAGHGVPHPATQESYLLPVDVSPNDLANGGIRLTDLVERLVQSGAGRIWIFLDACFSGGAREESPLAARGIRLRPKPVVLTGPTILIAAGTADEESLPYHQARHGLFTYFLLRALKNQGCRPKPIQVLLEEAATETTRYALLLHNKMQRPTWVLSPALREETLSQPW